MTTILNFQSTAEHIDNMIVHPSIATERNIAGTIWVLNAAAVYLKKAFAFKISSIQNISIIVVHGIVE